MDHRWSGLLLVLFAIQLALAGVTVSPAWAGETAPAVAGEAPAVPDEVRALAGTYAGVWTMYGLDDAGAAVKRMAWADTMRAENPRIEGDRAFLSTVDEMVFEGSAAPPYRVEGREGFFLDAEGRVGDGFIENSSQVVRLVKLSDNIWSYVTPAAAGELGMLGFPAGAEGSHVVVKVVTREAGVETHRISRVTTVHWTDATGAERWTQFLSLQGFHKRLQ